MFKKNSINITLGITFFGIIYILILYLLSTLKVDGMPLIYRSNYYYYHKGGNTHQKFLEIDSLKYSDIIILGSSHAYRGYDPRIFEEYGYTAFNLGSSGQTIFNTYFIAQKYVKNCRLVILDVFEGGFEEQSDPIESSLDLITNITSNEVAFKIAVANSDFRTMNVFALRLLNNHKPPMYIDSSYVGRGYCVKYDSLKQENKENNKYKVVISDTNWEYFKKLLDYFKNQNIKVIAVNHPYKNYNNFKEHQIYIKTLSEELNKYNIPILDYAYCLNLDHKNHFYDNTHLNQSGVAIFNKTLLHDLKKYDF